MEHSKTAEAFEQIINEFRDGIPVKSFLVRELLNELVGLLVRQTGKNGLCCRGA